MSQALKQAWWAPLVGLLILAQLALAVISGTGSEDGESKMVGVIICLGGALLLAAGLWRRPQARGLSNALIVVGALMAAFWFWTLVLPVVAIIVIIGVVTSEMQARGRAADARHAA